MMVARRLVAAVLATAAFGLLFRPDTYTSGTYRWAFDLAGPRWWGAAMAITAFLAASRHVPLVVHFVAVTGVTLSWTAALATAVATGDAETFTGPAWPAGIAALTIYAATVPVDDR